MSIPWIEYKSVLTKLSIPEKKINSTYGHCGTAPFSFRRRGGG